MSDVRLRKVRVEPRTYARLKVLAGEFGIERVSALPKESVVQAIVKSGTNGAGFLALLVRNGLKANYTDLELDSKGRKKQVKDTCKFGGTPRFSRSDIESWIKLQPATSPKRAASKVSNKGDQK